MKLKSWTAVVKNPFKIGYRVIGEFLADDGPFIAAGISFYAFFSLFPLVLISVAILSYVYTPEEAIKGAINLTALFVPDDMSSFLEANVREIFSSGKKVGLAGILILLWSGRQLFRAMELSLHRAWNIPLNRNWLVGNLLAMMLVLLCTAVVLSVGAISLFLTWFRHTLDTASLPRLLDQGWTVADLYVFSKIHSWVVVPGAVALIFLLLYMILPSKQVPVAMAVPGALFASAAWKLSSWFYLTYILSFGAKNVFYGTIWSIVGLLVWLYIEASVFMLGAELVFVTMDSKDLAVLGGKAQKKKRG
jgi:membrane protein